MNDTKETNSDPEINPQAGRDGLLALKIRSLIADEEMVTAAANMSLQQYGQWNCDYQAWHREIDKELSELFEKANV